MIRPSRKASALLAVTILIISCDVSTFVAPPQVIPTAAPGAIDTIVAQTAAAALTQTAALLPPTLTPSITPLPSQTPSITPTPTASFVFRLPTTTKVKTATPIPSSGGSGGSGGGGGGSASGFECSLVSRNPDNGASFNPGQSFTESWKLKNTGSEKWASSTVDFIYVSGENMASITGMDLPSTVNPGGTITLSVNMTAPSGAGTHKTTWSLRAGKNQFCSVSLSITVK
jgi:hypothetical protein